MILGLSREMSNNYSIRSGVNPVKKRKRDQILTLASSRGMQELYGLLGGLNVSQG